MAQWIKVFATKPDSLSSIPTPHLVEGEGDPCKLSSDLHVCPHACAHMHTCTPHIQNVIKVIFSNAVNLYRDSQLSRSNTKSRYFAIRSTTGYLCHCETGTNLSKCVLFWSCHLARTLKAWSALKSNLSTWRVSYVFNKCGYHTLEFLEIIWVFLEVLCTFSYLHWFLEGACKRNSVGSVIPISQVGM